MKKVFRWICVLPASVLACVFVYLTFVVIDYAVLRFGFPFFYSEGIASITESVNKVILELLKIAGTCISAYMFILAGCYVAPAMKRQTAVALAVLAFIILGFTLVSPVADTEHSWIYYIEYAFTFAGLVAGVFGAIKLYNEDEEEKK